MQFCNPSCDSFALMDAGVAGFEEAQSAQCATFYGAGCALYQDLFTDLTTLGAPPTPPPPPLPPLGVEADVAVLRPVRIFFAMGPSPNMETSTVLPGGSDAEATTPYRRRHLQSADVDGEGAEILDASDDPAIIDACAEPEAPDKLSLCETNGYENAVRLAPFQTRTHSTQPICNPC
jgi:hypothetical protein